MLYVFGRDTCQMNTKEALWPFSDLKVAPVDLGPGFLDQDGPEALAGWAAESWQVGFFVHWNEVVNNDRCSESVYEEFHSVDTCWVYFSCDKDLLDTVRGLGQLTQISQEIAVSDFALIKLIDIEFTIFIHI